MTMKSAGSWGAVLLVTASGAALAWEPGPFAQSTAEEIVGSFSREGDHWEIKEDGWCADSVAELADDKIPDSFKVKLDAEFPDAAKWPAGSLPAGTYPIGALRPLCKLVTAARGVEHTLSFAAAAPGWIEQFEPGSFPDIPVKTVKHCLSTYALTIAAGVDPATPTDFTYRSHDKDTAFKGSFKEAKEKLCDAGKQAIDKILEPLLAPYKKALKGDKLQMALDQYPAGYILPGGGWEQNDPSKLAKANAWFFDLTTAGDLARCLKEIHTVRRFAFDGGGKLTSTTEKQYCGEPPSSAFK